MSLELPELDYKKAVGEITDFIRGTMGRSGAEGVVIGVSGGVDSSLTATLCVRSLGKENVLGLLLPAEFTPKEDIEDAKFIAEWLGIRLKRVDIGRISDSFFKELGAERHDAKFRIPMANIRARVRMIILYYHANLYKYLVAGTGDRSEILIGYYTKYGDGGVDFLPIAHLYKTQVRELSSYLGIPRRIAYKPSSPQLYPGHRATDEIPLDYELLDPILYGLYDLKLTPREVSSKCSVPLKVVEDVIRRFERTAHKRSLPPRIET